MVTECVNCHSFESSFGMDFSSTFGDRRQLLLDSLLAVIGGCETLSLTIAGVVYTHDEVLKASSHA